MYSSKDFQKLWFLYKTEGSPKGVSIESFCETNGVPYEQFHTWYRKTYRAVSPVHVDGMPHAEGSVTSHDAVPSDSSSDSRGGILVSIKTRDGLHVQKGGLTYAGLKLLVERLEGLC